MQEPAERMPAIVGRLCIAAVGCDFSSRFVVAIARYDVPSRQACAAPRFASQD